MNTQVKAAMQVFGSIARKVAESAVHAAVFAFVSKKVTDVMKKYEQKNEETTKVRLVDDKTDSTETV